MDRKLLRQVLVTAIFVTSWLSGLTTAEGCWFRRMFGGGSQTTYMLPVAAAPAPAPAATCTTNYPPAWQQVMYAPQTQYQTMWRPYPITTYRPVGVNGLVPTATYGWQANRPPVVAYQPVVTAAPTAPVTTAAPVTVPAASVAPTLRPSCNCAAADTTAYYGSTSAWSPVTTQAYTDPGTAGTTVTGYAPSGTANYGSASPWTPVTQAATSSYASGYAPESSPSSTTLKPWQVPSDDSAVNGATPWMTVDEFKRQQQAAAAEDESPTPANEVPQLLPKASTSRVPVLDNDRTAQWKTYDDESNRRAIDVSPNAAGASVRYQPPSEQQQLLPFNRPIPDPERRGDSWDFDDKLQLQGRDSRSARATTRWRAIPVSTASSRSTSNSPLDQLLEPPRRTSPRVEGGWKSAR